MPEKSLPSAVAASRVALACWVAITVYLSVVSEPPISPIAGSDKLSHFLAYSVHGILLAWSFPRRASLGFGAAAIVTLGVVLEAVQAYLPSRAFSLADMVANLAGLGCGLALGWRLVAGAPRRWRAAGSGRPAADEPAPDETTDVPL